MRLAINKYKGLLKAILGISIIGMFVFNNIVFLHSHKLDNGLIVIHAHPFKKSNDTEPFKIHKHTTAELIIIQSLQLFLLAIILVVTVALVQNQQAFFNGITPFYFAINISVFKVRPPPLAFRQK
ncbi:MAG: hypothetical protein JXR61_04260 [Prolixibacteraceae bacterium]|nr:hypothetical protein [Prolixibacteraceae bacterium]